MIPWSWSRPQLSQRLKLFPTFKAFLAPHPCSFGHAVPSLRLESSWPFGALPAARRPPGLSVLSSALSHFWLLAQSVRLRSAHGLSRITQWIPGNGVPGIRAFRVTRSFGIATPMQSPNKKQTNKVLSVPVVRRATHSEKIDKYLTLNNKRNMQTSQVGDGAKQPGDQE